MPKWIKFFFEGDEGNNEGGIKILVKGCKMNYNRKERGMKNISSS
jgi:hypothetical protein